MNYQKHYNLIISRAQARNRLECYTESHHVIPKVLGGNNTPDNLVKLTAAEHFVAHLLLVKIHPSNFGLSTAAYLMARGNGERSNNKKYSWLKEKFIIASSLSGKINGKKAFEKRTGIHALTKTQRARNSSMVGITTRINKRGIHALSSEQRSINARISVDKKLGIHAQTKEQLSVLGKKSTNGELTKTRKTGIHSQTKEQRAIFGRASMAQCWRCCECAMTTNAGNLTRHQKASGHTGRTRL